MKTHINLLIICFVIKLQTTIISCSINAVISKYFSESCGSIDSQVIYQTKAKIGETPWIAAIRSQNNDNKKRLEWCNTAGVLISRKHVLSAGSCVNRYGYTVKSVILGETDFDQAIDCEKDVCADAPIEVPVANSYSRFDRRCPLADNIALIVLSMEVTYSVWIQPICLPNVGHLKSSRIYIGGQFITCGWLDIDSSPEKTIKKFITDNNEICDEVKGFDSYDPFYHMCVNNTDIHSDYGPIMSVDTIDPGKPFWYICGFFGYWRPGNRPAVGTKVWPYLDWIFTIIRDNDT